MAQLEGAYASLQALIRLEYAARGFSFLPRQPVHSVLAGRHASRLRGRGLNFEELRRYLPGDDVRDIDWRVTARTRKPHVRVYTEETDRPVILVVDQRLNMFFGTRRAMKSVTAAETAALAAWRTLSVGDRVGAVVFGDDGIEEVRCHRSRENVMRILGVIAARNEKLSPAQPAARSSGMLDEALRRAARSAHHDHLVCVITDFHDGGEETQRRITEIGEHNDVIIGFVYDPAEAEMQDVGRVVVGSGELQLEVDTSGAGLRRSFREDFEERLEMIRALARRRGVPVLALETASEVPAQLRRLLGVDAPGRG